MKWLWLSFVLHGSAAPWPDSPATTTPVVMDQKTPVSWESLMPPEDLSGWKIVGGSATYRIEDSQLIGQSSAGSPNTWLVTERNFGDFELEYEFLCDPSLNSGVQIRSEANGAMARGFQVEIDVDDKRKRFWSAGLYEEGDRGWIDDLSDNPEARAAHKPHDWNHVRIVAVGAHLQTWLNGVPAAEVFDTRRLSGFIGLQVHGVGQRQDSPLEIRWRGLRVRDLGSHRWALLNPPTDSGWVETITLPEACSTFRIELTTEKDAPPVAIHWRKGAIRLEFSTTSIDYSYSGEPSVDPSGNTVFGPIHTGRIGFRGRFQVFSGDLEKCSLVVNDGKERHLWEIPGPPRGGQILLSGRRTRIRTIETLIPSDALKKPREKAPEDVAPKTTLR
ncbi:MAG: DUF1080 domain-containing protein [Planctomycetota bacterium]|nr:DUF1080 domain-containing protein [Planctomycetota bacterium]